MPRADSSATPFDADRGSFRSSVRRFVAREIAPNVQRWERSATVPRAALRACGRRGYLGLDVAQAAIFAEELPRCDSMGVALAVFVQAGLIAPLLEQHANPEQKRKYLSPLLRGQRIGALAVTEPQAGSDLAGIQATARPGGTRAASTLTVNGEKTYITCAAAADFLIVAARVGDGAATDTDLSLLVLPVPSRGLRVTPLRALGLATTAMGRVVLRNCRIPSSAILGERGAGYGYVLDALDRERLYGGIGAVAWAERAIARTVEFLRERKAFGKPISRMQAVRHQLAESSTALAAARALNYRAYASWSAKSAGALRDIAMVKLFSYRAAQQAIELCLQLHGGLGYMEDHWTSAWYRDARALTIAAGTPEVMRDLIAAHMRL